MFNTNLIHNVLNVAIAVIGAMLAFQWDVLFSTETAAWIIGALGTLKLVINTIRDGISGLVKNQPPVQ